MELKVCFDDGIKYRIYEALCAAGRRPAQVVIDGKTLDNPASMEEFAKNMIGAWILQIVGSYEYGKEAEAARLEKEAQVKSEIAISVQ